MPLQANTRSNPTRPVACTVTAFDSVDVPSYSLAMQTGNQSARYDTRRCPA